MHDIKTHDYFDNFTPHYNPKRFGFALDYLNNVANQEQTLLDIGCGDGATLYMIKKMTPLKKLVGLDISQTYLEKAKKLTGCNTIQGSILNKEELRNHWGRFDYCVLGAVLHHLIGKNRTQSFQYAQTALHHAAGLLKPGGNLIIFEPTHSPSVAMTFVFWIKKIIGGFVDRRLELSARWANIGQPVVSYYTPPQLYKLIENIDFLKGCQNIIVDESRLGLIIHRKGIGLILKKDLKK